MGVSEALCRYRSVLVDSAKTYACVSVAYSRPLEAEARAVTGVLARHGIEDRDFAVSDWAPKQYGCVENLIDESNALLQRFNVSRFELRHLLSHETAYPLTTSLRDDITEIQGRSIDHLVQLREAANETRIVQLRATVAPEYISAFEHKKVNAQAVLAARRLSDAGVPIAYAEAIEPIYRMQPQTATHIVKAFAAGLTPEYVKATIS